MAEYHVGLGITAIWAGRLNKAKTMWVEKSNVTAEACLAVAYYLLDEEDKTVRFTANGKNYVMSVRPEEEKDGE